MPRMNHSQPGPGICSDLRRMDLRTYETAATASSAAADALASEMRRLVESSGRAIGIFDSDETHLGLWSRLCATSGIPWTLVIGLQLAEILGEDENSPASRRRFLTDNLVRQVPMAEFHGIRGEAANPEAVCANYEALLNSRPPDFAVLGIGDGGSLGGLVTAESDLDETASVRIVRQGPFRQNWITLTMPAILSCGALFILATGAEKAVSMREALLEPVSKDCPASMLRTHPNVVFFLDSESASQI